MRTTVFIFCWFTLNWCSAQVNQLNLASDIWPPFTNVEPHRSFATDLVEEALKRAGISSDTEILEFQEVMDGIRQGEFHGSAALWYSEDREQILLFSAPYLQNQLILVGLKGADVSMTSLAELTEKKVAVVGNYAYGSEVKDAMNVTFVKGKNDQQNLERLLKQEVDYILVDALLMEYLLTHQQEEVNKYLQVGKVPLFKRALHFAIRKDIEGAQSIIERFNKRIIKMMADGTYNNILQLNWIRADVDGDGKMEMIAGHQVGKAEPSSSYDVWFQDSSTGPRNNRYYVDGQVYQGWDSVPQQYKTQPIVDERPEDLKLLKFSF
ncbi:MAG: hypothetical protein DHS20C17_20520 [Cyclobacteriaceae bacterium]|nr:MAG: hypothetical protein DHS20C17_20520 [Cyclobacteriaceae bacterium]